MERTHVAEAARLVGNTAGKRLALQLAINGDRIPMVFKNFDAHAVRRHDKRLVPNNHWFRKILGDYSFPCHTLDRCTARPAGGMMWAPATRPEGFG